MWELIGEVPAGVTVFDDEGLAPGTEYCYQVAAFNAAGESAPSNEACATTAAEGGSLTLERQGVFAPGAEQFDHFAPGAAAMQTR